MIFLAPLLQAFFTERLQQQKQASPNTIASYRDTFRLLLEFAQCRLGKAPTDLLLADLDASFIAEFLNHLEQERGNGARTRNTRLAAIRSFFRFAATREPAVLGLIQGVLAIPQKKFERRQVTFLTKPEIEALLAAPDRMTKLGRRDHMLILLALQTGLRVSELTALRIEDCAFGASAHVRCLGKGRKERCTPIRREVAVALKSWIENNGTEQRDLVFLSQRGNRLSRDAVERLVAKHVETAAKTCSTLAKKHVTPHSLRHTTAVQLLQSGVDRAVIALWLGHESVETTQIYLDADLAMKERALARTAPPGVGKRRYRPPNTLLAFLEAL
jgi:site-specific recombinase XerD